MVLFQQYRTAVRQLGYRNFKSTLDSWAFRLFLIMIEQKIVGILYQYTHIEFLVSMW